MRSLYQIKKTMIFYPFYKLILYTKRNKINSVWNLVTYVLLKTQLYVESPYFTNGLSIESYACINITLIKTRFLPIICYEVSIKRDIVNNPVGEWHFAYVYHLSTTYWIFNSHVFKFFIKKPGKQKKYITKVYFGNASW